MSGYKPGDEVIIQGRGRYRRERFTGHVTRVARKYAFAEFTETWTDSSGSEQRRQREIAFDVESGQQRGTSEFRVRTPEQVDRDERKQAATKVLRGAGIEFKLGYAHFFTTEQVEALAEVVRTWDQEGER